MAIVSLGCMSGIGQTRIPSDVSLRHITAPSRHLSVTESSLVLLAPVSGECSWQRPIPNFYLSNVRAVLSALRE
jgi:hypothetical protein